MLGEIFFLKWIVLFVFVFDVFLSVVYVFDEIFIILFLVGIVGFVFLWKIGIVVVLVMFIVVMSYC